MRKAERAKVEKEKEEMKLEHEKKEKEWKKEKERIQEEGVQVAMSAFDKGFLAGEQSVLGVRERAVAAGRPAHGQQFNQEYEDRKAAILGIKN